MALDKSITTADIFVNAQSANLDKTFIALQRQIGDLARSIQRAMQGMPDGVRKLDADTAKLVKSLQQVAGQAKLIGTAMDQAAGRNRKNLFTELDEQNIGKKTRAVSKLRQEITEVTSVSRALELRLAGVNRELAKAGNQGSTGGKTRLKMSEAFEDGLRRAKLFESQLDRLFTKMNGAGFQGTPKFLQALADYEKQYNRVLTRAQNPRQRNLTNDIKELERRAEVLRQIGAEELKTAAAAERTTASLIRSTEARSRLSEAQLRSTMASGARSYTYTDAQARTFNPDAISRGMERNLQRATQLQAAMRGLDRATATPETLARLQKMERLWETIRQAISKAQAQQQAFDRLPEQRASRARNYVKDMIFGDGGAAFAGRVAGASIIGSGVFAAMNALQGSLQYVTQMEDELAKLQAISGATDGEMLKLAASIYEVGNSSRYSTLEIAQGATTIAQAGYSASETALVLRDSLNLAAASGSTPADAIDLMTSALGAFNLQASESAQVADTVTAALNETKLSVEQMRAVIQYAGATARENNIGLNELSAVAGSLANAGVRSGSTIGTGLRQLLVDLKTPTEKLKDELEALGLTIDSVDVSALGLEQVVRNLSDAGFSASAAYEGLEVRAAAAFLAFRGQLDTYDQLAASLQQSGAAARAAAEASDSLSAKWTTLKNNLGTLVSALAGPLLEVLKDLLDLAIPLAETLVKFSEVVKVIPALLGFTQALGGTSDGMSSLIQATNEAQAKLDTTRQTISSLDEAVGALIDRQELLRNDQNALAGEAVTLSDRFSGLSQQLDFTKLSYEGLLDAMQAVTEESIRQQQAEAVATVAAANNEIRGFEGGFSQTRRRVTTLRNLQGVRPEFRDLVTQRIQSGTTEGQGALLNILRDLNTVTSRMSRAGNLTNTEQRLLQFLEQMVVNASSLSSSRANRDQAQRVVDTSDAYFTTDRGAARRATTDIRLAIGSGNLADAEARLRAQRTADEARLNSLPEGSAARAQVQSSLTSYRALEADIERQRRDAANEAEAAANSSDTGNVQVQFRQPVRGNRTSGFGVRRDPITGARRTHAGIDYAAAAGTPVYAAADGVVTFVGNRSGYGNVVEVSHGNGVISRYAHLLDGSTVVREGDAVATSSQLAGVGSTGRSTGNHLHFEVLKEGAAMNMDQLGWRMTVNPSGALADGAAADQALYERIQKAIQDAATARTGAASSDMSRISREARSGVGVTSTLIDQIRPAMDEFKAASLAEFDAKNPTFGLLGEELANLQTERAAFERDINQQAQDFFAQTWGALADGTLNQIELASDRATTALESGLYSAQQGVRDADFVDAVLGNDRNRFNVGAGDLYAAQRARVQAEQQARVAQLNPYDRYIETQSGLLGQARGALDTLRSNGIDPQSEVYLQQEQRVRDINNELVEILQRRAELTREIQASESANSDEPLITKLQNSADAWLENSGAMDTWSKTLQNNVGPLLDQFTSGFTDLFSSIIDGTKSVTGALKDFLVNFAQFVVQMIARALALKLVKSILSSIGLGTPAYEGGPVVGKYDGGPIIEGLNSGGPVRRGFSTHDSALYNLAQGEYVVNNRAVKDIGMQNMEMINKFGRKGLSKVAGSAFTNIQMPRQETNVYVVQDKADAPMGPNDVLVTIQRDIMQNGPTKRLIKQVAQGA